MSSALDRHAAEVVREGCRPLSGVHTDYNDLLEARARAVDIVLIGEASHGTHEFYRERARLTKRLIREAGFTAVAVEADWPDALRVNRFVTASGGDPDAADALRGFERFPEWMWRNAEVLDFVGWLREHNDALPHRRERVGFYGLDLYSLRASMDAVIAYLDRVDPAEAARARRRYACFDQFGPDAESYASLTGLAGGRSCENEVVAQLVALQSAAAQLVRTQGQASRDELFYAVENARVAKDAERYYRTMFSQEISSWNLRDAHMAETLGRLAEHLRQYQPGPKLVVWAHNSHVGDARATEMGWRGEHNLGHLVRLQPARSSFSVGFTTFSGTVTAASEWYEPAQRKTVQPALEGSYESIFHLTGVPRFSLDLREGGAVAELLTKPRLERAIGVIYRPETERASHYFYASLSRQFDAVVHLDRSRAVEPLERSPHWDSAEAPETFPSGI